MAIDLICGIIAAYGFWQGYNRGIVTTIFNVLAYVFGLIVALKVTPYTTELLETLFKTDNPLMFIAGFLTNIFVVVFVLKQAANGIENMLNFAHLGTINKILGGVVSGALAILIYSIIVWFGVKSHMLNDVLIADSKTYKPLLETMPPKAKDVAFRLKPFAEEGWNTFTVWLNRVDSYKKTGSSGSSDLEETAPDGSERRIRNLPKDDGIERTTRE
jgi:membrane protein required for colicin V production